MTATLTVTFAPASSAPDYPMIVTAAASDEGFLLSASASAQDERRGGAVSRAAVETEFKGKLGQTLVIRDDESTVILIGTGKEPLTGKIAEDLGGHVFSAFSKAGVSALTFAADNLDTQTLADIAHGAHLASYVFKHYFTKGEAAEMKMKALTFYSDHDIEPTYKARAELAAGIFLARDLVYEPANRLYPESYAERCAALSEYGLNVTILDEKAMQEEGMALLLSVGQGSRRASRMAVMEWQGGGDEAPIALIGKGVCFDTGGISIKPASGMEDMKWDMGGSAAVVGAMRAVAGLKLKRNIVGLVGLVENMPDGEATRPGDVVTSMSGQTVEIINTDAEGRLVLADMLTYAIKHYAPQKMIDLATLTGAIIVALGKEHAGLFSNNDGLSETLVAAGIEVGEKAWRMPMGQEYDELLKSHIADMKNIGGRWGGSITAACFLERFVEDVPWAHLDIAGMAWSDKSAPTIPKGGTGFGVRLLTRFLEQDE